MTAPVAARIGDHRRVGARVRRSRTRATIAVGVVVSLAVLLALVVVLAGVGRPVRPVAPVVPQPPAAAPDARVTSAPPPGPTPVLPVASWARALAPALGIDQRALSAYGAAQLAIRRLAPHCRLSWPTLAGIGWVESRNGSYGGASVDPDGVVRPTIIGPALDGSAGLALIRSTDGGRLDGDTVYDHAVGPMQLLPSTWRRYGRGNPSDYDAAALAAARYLCARSPMATADGWRKGVLAYNHSASYLADVRAAAGWYAAGGD